MSSSERMTPPESQTVEQLIAKKHKRFAAILAGCALFMAVTIHDGGFRFFPSKINLESKTYEQLTNPSDGNAYILTDRILEKDGIYEYAHRSGNTIASMDEAAEMGANIIDLDLTDVDGELYGEHGLVEKKKIPGTDISVTLVMDPNEVELSTKTPATFEELIKHAAFLREKYKRELMFYIECKHGEFGDIALAKTVNTLFKYNMPAIIQPSQQGSRDRLDTIRMIHNVKENASVPYV